MLSLILDSEPEVEVDLEEPEASFDAPSQVEVGEEFTLDGSNSEAGMHDIEEYNWSVNDETLQGSETGYSFNSEGNHSVALQVTDSEGVTDQAERTVEAVDTDSSQENSDDNETDDSDSTEKDDDGNGDGDRDDDSDEDGDENLLTRILDMLLFR